MKIFHLYFSNPRKPHLGVLIGIVVELSFASCAKFSKIEPHHLFSKESAGKVETAQTRSDAPDSNSQQSPKQPKPNSATTDQWPESWKVYHKHFNNYLEARKKHWPHPEIKFQKPFGLEWELIVSKDSGSYNSQKRDGIQFFRNGRHYLTRGFSDSKRLLQSFNPGGYAVSVRRHVGEYQHMSRPFYFSVIVGKDEASGKISKRIELYHPESEGGLFPNQWWYYQIDFFWWDTHGRPPEKNGKKPERPHVSPGLMFFTNRRPFEPTISMTETKGENGPIAKRNLLSPELENLLELRLYYEGKLMKTEPATGIESWTFDHGPGHYVFLIVAPDNDGGALIVARPFQAWFPDEGDGVLRLIPLDTDKDGMPDYWEKWHDLDPKNPKDASKSYQNSKKVSYLDYYKSQKSYNRVR